MRVIYFLYIAANYILYTCNFIVLSVQHNFQSIPNYLADDHARHDAIRASWHC